MEKENNVAKSLQEKKIHEYELIVKDINMEITTINSKIDQKQSTINTLINFLSSIGFNLTDLDEPNIEVSIISQWKTKTEPISQILND